MSKTPVQHPCSFGECAEPAMYFFCQPGADAQTRMRVMVGTCRLHREHGEQLLAAKLDAAARDRATEMAVKARQAEGRLL